MKYNIVNLFLVLGEIIHFRWIHYVVKWTERRAKALHSQSDFGCPVY
jgi:hypothetical protein